MKYIITEDKLRDVIYNYINNYYDVDEIHSNPIHDEDGQPLDTAEEFYVGDYSDDEFVFTLYQKNYWTSSHDFRKELSPILMIENENFASYLNSMFGERWKPIFKEWFEENFGKEIKTIDNY
jgi:hypothetical protein